MLPPGKVAGKVILALALVPTNVALEGVLIPMTPHVDGVEDVVREVDVTVLAVMKHVGVLQWGRQAWGRCAGLAVGDTRGTSVHAMLTAGSLSRTAVTVRRSPWLWGDGGRRGSHIGCNSHRCCGRVWLLDEEGFFINYRLSTGGHRRLSQSLSVRREAGQLASQSRQLVQGVIHYHIMVVVILICRDSFLTLPTVVIISFLA